MGAHKAGAHAGIGLSGLLAPRRYDGGPMRGFLRWLLLVAVLGGVAFFLAPIVARPLVADAVRAASPFGSQPLEVDVDVDALGLLGGKVTRIHMTGANLSASGLEIAGLDVTATDVGILDRSFASIAGTLESVALRRSDGTEIQAREVRLAGPSDAVEATASVSRRAALDIVGRELAAAGLPTANLELIDGGIRVSVLGQRSDVALAAAGGAVTIAGSIAGGGPIVVFGPEPGDPWRVTGVAVSPNGLEVHTSIDLGAVLRAR